jgi:hypothetical protein
VLILLAQIFNQHERGNECNGDTFALPGGSGSMLSRSNKARKMPLDEIIGFNLPLRNVTDFLVETYFDSVHWFMMVVHEPSFRADYDRLVTSRMASEYDTPFVVLLLMVLSIGCEQIPRFVADILTDLSLSSICYRIVNTRALSRDRHAVFAGNPAE